MIEYKEMYFHLFNAVTDAIERLPENEVRDNLIAAQQQCEEIYMTAIEERQNFEELR